MRLFKLCIALLITAGANAQGIVQPWTYRDNSFHYRANFGNGSSVVTHPSAVLELKGSLGFLPTRMTTVQRDAIPAPANALMIFNTDLGRYQYYLNGAWVDFSPSAPGAAPVTSVHGRTGAVTAQDGDYTLQQVMAGDNSTRIPFIMKSSNTANNGMLVRIGETSPTNGQLEVRSTSTPGRYVNLTPGNIQSFDYQFQSDAGGTVLMSYAGTGFYSQTLQAKSGEIALKSDIPADHTYLA
ncbi:MAG: hypothetical protein EOP84_05600, partial [Verrucomicrobiaceae bacterium]